MKKKQNKKKIRLAIGSPTSGYCRVEWAESILELQKAFLRDKRFNVEDVCLFFVSSSVIPENRHKIVRFAQKWKATHMLFIDDDMRFFPQAGLSLMHTMLNSDIQILGANCIKREYPMQFMATDFDNKEVRSDLREGLEQVKYTGNSFILMDMSIFDKISLPWFAFPWNQETERFGTEDSFFQIKALKEANIPTIVDHDVSMIIHHVGPHIFDPLQPRIIDTNAPLPEGLKKIKEAMEASKNFAEESLIVQDKEEKENEDSPD